MNYWELVQAYCNNGMLAFLWGWSSLITGWGLLSLYLAIHAQSARPAFAALTVMTAAMFRIPAPEPMYYLLAEAATIHLGVAGYRTWCLLWATPGWRAKWLALLPKRWSPQYSLLVLMLAGTTLVLVGVASSKAIPDVDAMAVEFPIAGFLAGLNFLWFGWVGYAAVNWWWKCGFLLLLVLGNRLAAFPSLVLSDRPIIDPQENFLHAACACPGWTLRFDTASTESLRSLQTLFLLTLPFWFSAVGCMLLYGDKKANSEPSTPESAKLHSGAWSLRKRLAWVWFLLLAGPGFAVVFSWPAVKIMPAVAAPAPAKELDALWSLFVVKENESNDVPTITDWTQRLANSSELVGLSARQEERMRAEEMDNEEPAEESAETSAETAAGSLDFGPTPSDSQLLAKSTSLAEVDSILTQFRAAWDARNPRLNRSHLPVAGVQVLSDSGQSFAMNLALMANRAAEEGDPERAILYSLEALRMGRLFESDPRQVVDNYASFSDLYALQQLAKLTSDRALSKELLHHLLEELLALHAAAITPEQFQQELQRKQLQQFGWRVSIRRYSPQRSYTFELGFNFRRHRALWRLLILELALQSVESTDPTTIKSLADLPVPPEVLSDPFAPHGEPFHYKLEDGKLIPYTVWINGRDDQGLHDKEGEPGAKRDDVSLQDSANSIPEFFED